MEKKTNQIQKQIKRITHKHERLNDKLNFRKGLDSVSLRKSRTRTLIQLGGLVEKTNIINSLNIALGDDLQKNEEKFDSVAIIVGALADIQESLINDKTQKNLWMEKGKKILSSNLV